MTICWCFLVPPYQVQPSAPAEDQPEPEAPRAVVDQSKAPGFRGNTKSPVVETPTTSGSKCHLYLVFLLRHLKITEIPDSYLGVPEVDKYVTVCK